MIMFSMPTLIALILRLITAYIWTAILRENWYRTPNWFHSAAMFYILWLLFAMVFIVGSDTTGHSWLAYFSYTVGNASHCAIALATRMVLKDWGERGVARR